MLLPDCNAFECTPDDRTGRGAALSSGHVYRALRTLSAGNRTVVHASSEQQLLEQMCAVIVKEGGYPLA